MIISTLNFFWNNKNLQKKIVEEMKTLILYFFPKMRKNMVDPDRPQKTARCMRFLYWINKPTDIHAECVILIVFRWNNGHGKAPQYYVTRTLPVFKI